jgi:hypothetical protein
VQVADKQSTQGQVWLHPNGTYLFQPSMPAPLAVILGIPQGGSLFSEVTEGGFEPKVHVQGQEPNQDSYAMRLT